MADEVGLLDEADALAVVVDDGHLAAFFQYLAALHQTQLVCIHDDTERSLGNDGQSALGVDEVVLLPCRDEGVDEAARQSGVTAHGDDCRHIADLADAQHALGRTDGVQVAHPVAHDDHMVSLFDELDQLVGHDAAAHLAALFHAVADAAVEGKAVRGHLGGLVAAAPLRHIQRLNGHVLSLPQGLGPASDADGDGEVHAGVEGADLVQHVVAALGELLQLALFHHSDVAATGHAAQKARAAAYHIFQHPVDAFQQAGALAVQHIAEHVVVAVHEEDQIARAAGLIFGLHFAEGRFLIQDKKGHALGLAGDGGAVSVPHAVGQIEQLAADLACLLQVEAGQHFLHPGDQKGFALHQTGAELGVVPQHRLPRKEGGGLAQRLFDFSKLPPQTQRATQLRTR